MLIFFLLILGLPILQILLGFIFNRIIEWAELQGEMEAPLSWDILCPGLGLVVLSAGFLILFLGYREELLEALSASYGTKVGKNSSRREKGLAELVDGCYNVVELWKPESPSQVEWRKDWLKKAKKLVPHVDSLWL